MKSAPLVPFLLLFSFSLFLPQYTVPARAQSASPGTSMPTLGNKHINKLNAPHEPYNSKPPTSGPHVHNVAKWGIYRRQVANELQVHNLEDGGVLIQYDCKGCKDLRKKLEKLGRSYLKRSKKEGKGSRYAHIIVAPYADIGNKIALTAWGKIDKFDDFDEDRIRRFVEAYVGVDHHPK